MRHTDLLAELGWIEKAEPLWWDLDYPKDPRELLDFADFENRLQKIGNYPIVGRNATTDFDSRSDVSSRPRRCISAYQGDKVPVSILEVSVKRKKIPLFVTARPFTANEARYSNDYLLLNDGYFSALPSVNAEAENKKMIEQLGTELALKGYWEHPVMFLPHVRGYFKEKRGERIFYYRLGPDYKDAIWEEEIPKALKRQNKDYLITLRTQLDIFDRASQSEKELLERNAILTRKVRHNKVLRGDARYHARKTVEWDGLAHVVYDEFKPDGRDAASYYPVRVDGMNESAPIAFSNRPRPDSNLTGAYALGVFLDYSAGSWHENPKIQKLTVIPFTSHDFAGKVAKQLSDELGMEFNAVYMERTPGRQRYRLLT